MPDEGGDAAADAEPLARAEFARSAVGADPRARFVRGSCGGAHPRRAARALPLPNRRLRLLREGRSSGLPLSSNPGLKYPC